MRNRAILFEIDIRLAVIINSKNNIFGCSDDCNVGAFTVLQSLYNHLIFKHFLCCAPVINSCLFLFHPIIVTCARPKGYVCPQNISTGWMEIPPYVYRNETDESVIGPLVNILKDALDDCCLNNVTLDYIEHSEYSELVERSLNSSYDIVFPVVSDVGKDKFLAFPYVLLGMYLHYTGAYIHATIK